MGGNKVKTKKLNFGKNISFEAVENSINALALAGLSTGSFTRLSSNPKLAKEVANLIMGFNLSDIRQVWQMIYREYFNKEVDFSQLIIPERYNPQEHSCVIVARGITEMEVLNFLTERFWTHNMLKERSDWGKLKNDFDLVFDSERLPHEDYVVLFKRHSQASPEYETCGFSFAKLKERGLSCITFLERLLLRVVFDVMEEGGETKKLMDSVVYTLCLGTCDKEGQTIFLKEEYSSDGDNVPIISIMECDHSKILKVKYSTRVVIWTSYDYEKYKKLN